MKTEKFNNKYRILSNRRQGYDYGSSGLYFITICTKNKIHYFGKIVIPAETHNHSAETHNCASLEIKNRTSSPLETHNCASLMPTILGKIAHQYWQDIPIHYPFVEIDTFVIMPNHIHGILCINNPDKKNWQPNKFGPQSKNLGAIIRAYKSSVKRYANQYKIPFEWQANYHENIVRDDRGLNNIREYIKHNPKNWLIDTLNKSQL